MMKKLDAGLDNGKPIPESRRFPGGGRCQFCAGWEHYGFCDGMREYNARRAPRVLPIVNPRVRN